MVENGSGPKISPPNGSLTHLDHLPLRTWSTTSTQHYQHSLPSLAHLRVPITTIREHDRLPALSTTSTNYPYLGGTSSHASFVSDHLCLKIFLDGSAFQICAHTHTHKSYYIGPLTTRVPVCSPRAGFPRSGQGYRLWAGWYVCVCAALVA